MELRLGLFPQTETCQRLPAAKLMSGHGVLSDLSGSVNVSCVIMFVPSHTEIRSLLQLDQDLVSEAPFSTTDCDGPGARNGGCAASQSLRDWHRRDIMATVSGDIASGDWVQATRAGKRHLGRCDGGCSPRC